MARKQKKSDLKKHVPTRVGLIIIFFVAFAVGLYVMNKTIEVNGEMNSICLSFNGSLFKKSDGNCSNRGFEGSAQIHAWYEQQGNSQVLRIAESDLSNLPLFDNSKEYKAKNSSIKIVDLTPDLEKKLKAASKDNPVLITISGYVATCEGTPIACLKYDNIKPYIKK